MCVVMECWIFVRFIILIFNSRWDWLIGREKLIDELLSYFLEGIQIDWMGKKEEREYRAQREREREQLLFFHKFWGNCKMSIIFVLPALHMREFGASCQFAIFRF